MESTTYTSETHTTATQKPARSTGAQTAINVLAVIGFIALLFLGIALAIYAARYLPEELSHISKPDFFTSKHSEEPVLSIVPSYTNTNASDNAGVSTYPSSGETTTLPPPQSGDGYQAPAVAHPTYAPGYTPRKSSHYNYVAPVGLPDLAVAIVATGYLANGTNESFVPTAIIPAGARAAVRFTITNKSGKATGPWNFNVQLPHTNYVFVSPPEQSLNAGDHILFTLGFDQNVGPGPQVVTITADPNNSIAESNKSNNTVSTAFLIGS